MASKIIYKLDEIQNKLFEDNIQLANWAANNKFSYVDQYIPFSEKQQLFLISLAKACYTFQEDKGYKFASYAVKIMSNDCGMLMRKINREISRNTMSFDNILNNELSQEDFNSSLGDILEDKSVDVENDVENKLFIEEIQERIRIKYGVVYMQVYVMTISEGLSQYEIAEILNISRSWVSRINKCVFKYIRQRYFKVVNHEE